MITYTYNAMVRDWTGQTQCLALVNFGFGHCHYIHFDLALVTPVPGKEHDVLMYCREWTYKQHLTLESSKGEDRYEATIYKAGRCLNTELRDLGLAVA